MRIGYCTEAEVMEIAWVFDKTGYWISVFDIALQKQKPRGKHQEGLLKNHISVFPKDDQQSLIKEADDYFDKTEGVSILIEKVERILNVGRGN